MMTHSTRTFLLIWLGQLVSRLGTGLTRFGLLIWTYQQSGSATDVALLGFFSFIPMVLISPVAGVWIDRVDRRKIMFLADLGAGAATVVLLLLLGTGRFALWHLYLITAVAGTCEAFQGPAYGAITATLVSRGNVTRANGVRSLADAGAQLAAPFLSGMLLALFDLRTILLVDSATFLFAVGTLLLVRLPATIEVEQKRPNLHREMQLGLNVIRHDRGLRGLLVIFTAINFFAAITWYATLPALILARSGQSEMALATVEGALGIGALAGSIFISAWGGPRRKIHGVLLGIALSFLLGDMVLAVGHTLPIWALGAAVGAFFVPIISSCHTAIWQTVVPGHLHGRVLAFVNMARQAAAPAGYLLGGVMADHVMEPAMAPDGALAPLFGPLVGTGPGAGIGLMFVASAVLGILISLGGYLFVSIRDVEKATPVATVQLLSRADVAGSPLSTP
jgi:MFS family permease